MYKISIDLYSHEKLCNCSEKDLEGLIQILLSRVSPEEWE